MQEWGETRFERFVSDVLFGRWRWFIWSGGVLAALLVWSLVNILGLVGGNPSLRGADSPSWSPDGAKIVFQNDRPNGRPQIYVISADGSGLRRLSRGTAHDGYPTWSPDGKKIAFVESKILIHEDGSDERLLGHGDLWVVNADGSGRRQITLRDSMIRRSAWSPDGRWIAYEDTGAIYLVSPRGGVPKRLVSPGQIARFPSWSPDGSRIAYNSLDDRGGIRIVDTSSKKWRVLTAPDRSSGPWLEDNDPVWSPDGSRIAFYRFHVTLERSDQYGGIVVMNVDGSLDGSRVRWLTHHLYDVSPAWSPDGSKIAFSRNGKIYVMNADGSYQHRLTK